jgi:nucleoside-diphosphate-sugar epimerase
VLKAAGKLGVDNVVFASSCNIYGRATSMDIDESVDPDPINPYADAKYEAESLLREYCEDHDMQGTSLRMSTNYGYSPGIRFNLVVNYFVFRALTGRALTVYGDGSNWRPFIHVEDAARAYKSAALSPEDWDNDVYNVGSNDDNYQISEIAEVVREEVGPVDITYLEDEHPGPSYHVSFDRLGETGFETDWTLREGVRDLAERFMRE